MEESNIEQAKKNREEIEKSRNQYDISNVEINYDSREGLLEGLGAD